MCGTGEHTALYFRAGLFFLSENASVALEREGIELRLGICILWMIYNLSILLNRQPHPHAGCWGADGTLI